MHIRHLSLSLLQEKTGIRTARLSRILNGERTSESTIVKFATALSVDKVEAYRQIEEVRTENKLKKEVAK